MTLRTLTSLKEAKFALVFFEVDETFSVLETKKLQTETHGCDKERGTKVKVKSGPDVYEAEIIAVNDRKASLEETLSHIVSEDPVYGELVSDQPPNIAKRPSTKRKRGAKKSKKAQKKKKTTKKEEKKGKVSIFTSDDQVVSATDSESLRLQHSTPKHSETLPGAALIKESFDSDANRDVLVKLLEICLEILARVTAMGNNQTKCIARRSLKYI